MLIRATVWLFVLLLAMGQPATLLAVQTYGAPFGAVARHVTPVNPAVHPLKSVLSLPVYNP